jgi:hypothetical protein
MFSCVVSIEDVTPAIAVMTAKERRGKDGFGASVILIVVASKSSATQNDGVIRFDRRGMDLCTRDFVRQNKKGFNASG